MGSKVVRADFGSGLIRNRAQKCCVLKSSAPSGARQDNCADLLGLQTRRGSNHSAAHVGESNSRSNVFQIRRESVCVPSRWKVLSGEFRRRPTALAIKFRKSDRVGRRGLPEPREDFSQLLTYEFCGCVCGYVRGSILSRLRLRAQPLESSLGRVPQAADGTCYKIP
jgi:hypothetical protein